MNGRCKLFIHEFDREWNIVRQKVHELEKFYYCKIVIILADSLTDNFTLLCYRS